MNAGFSRVDITPALGTPLMGASLSTAERRAKAVHDPLHLRALYVEDRGAAALVVNLDLCFVGRLESDHFKAELGRAMGLAPEQVMLCASHNHSGPTLGVFGDANYAAPPWEYYRELSLALVEAACAARQSARLVTLRSGQTRSKLPMNRRQQRDGKIVNGPNPSGLVHDSLPMAVFEDGAGRPVCLLFAAAAHPVSISGPNVSADYPGEAMRLLDEHLGLACSLFLQGTGGDARPSTLVRQDSPDWDWHPGPVQMRQTGRLLAEEVIAALPGLQPDEPRLRCALVQTHWPLQPANRREYEQVLARVKQTNVAIDVHHEWAQRQLQRLERGTMPKSVGVLFHAVQIGSRTRLLAMEGEPVALFGQMMQNTFSGDVTFALGYTNGDALYLVSSDMLDAGGYEPESYWQYNLPSPLAKGTEQVVERGLAALREGLAT